MELDGNALAGDLAEIFTAEMTAARFTCAGCDHDAAVATLRVWGSVARCPTCDDVVLILVRTPTRVYLTLSGTARLELPL